MNYKEFQKRQQAPEESKILPGDPKKFAKKHKERKPWDFLNFISGMANPLSVLAVISMFVFFKNLPVIPMILSLLTMISFYVRYTRNKCEIWLPFIWMANTIMWSLTTAITS